MKTYISVISLLTFTDFVRYSIFGIWPKFETIVARAKAIGADGVQVLILKGWHAEDIRASSDVCSIESSWDGALGRMLFDADSKEIIERIQVWRNLRGYPTIPTVDISNKNGSWKAGTLIEVANCEDRIDIVSAALNGKVIPYGLVYDTHHAREVLPDSTRDEWMLPIAQVFLGTEPKKSRLYRKDIIFQYDYNEALAAQLEKLAPYIRLIQIQTRSKQEAASVMKISMSKPSILQEQLLLLEEAFTYGTIKREEVRIVIEVPPWWGWLSRSFKKKFFHAVKGFIAE